MPTIALSEAALALFRRHVEQKGKIPLDDSTREPYRELAAAGLMCLGRPFVGGKGIPADGGRIRAESRTTSRHEGNSMTGCVGYCGQCATMAEQPTFPLP